MLNNVANDFIFKKQKVKQNLAYEPAIKKWSENEYIIIEYIEKDAR